MYDKTNWVTGDIVTAEKLNNIENGIKSNESTWMRLHGYMSNAEDIYPNEAIIFNIKEFDDEENEDIKYNITSADVITISGIVCGWGLNYFNTIQTALPYNEDYPANVGIAGTNQSGETIEAYSMDVDVWISVLNPVLVEVDVEVD